MLVVAIGLALGMALGAFCRWFDIPSPAPPSLVGALILVSITLGFMAADILPKSGSEITTHRTGQ